MLREWIFFRGFQHAKFHRIEKCWVFCAIYKRIWRFVGFSIHWMINKENQFVSKKEVFQHCTSNEDCLVTDSATHTWRWWLWKCIKSVMISMRYLTRKLFELTGNGMFGFGLKAKSILYFTAHLATPMTWQKRYFVYSLVITIFFDLCGDAQMRHIGQHSCNG